MRFPIAFRILRDLRREKTFVFALFLQFFLILSIYVILGFTSIFFSPQTLLAEKIDVGVVGKTSLTPFINSSRYANVVVFEDPNEAVVTFMEGDVDVVVVEESKSIPLNYTIYLPESKLQSTIILSVLKEQFELLEDYLRHSQVDADAIPLRQIRVVGRPRPGSDYLYELLYGLLIPYLLLVPVFLVGSLVIDLMCEEIERKTISLLLIASSLRRVYLEVLAAALVLIFVQLVIWMGFLRFQGVVIANTEFILLYLLVLSSLIFLLGMLLSVTLKIKSRAQLIYSIAVMGVSASSGLSSLNPVSVISRLSLGVEGVDWLSFLVLLPFIFAVYILLVRRRVAEDII